MVLELGWAHGPGVNHLEDKQVFATITSGGSRESYSHGGFNRHTMPELLFALQQAAHLCRMIWLPPYAVQGTYQLTDGMLADYADEYRQLLQLLAQSPPLESLQGYELLNDWIAGVTRKEQP